ncbi:uncharacterized protein [Antedon mediterranea]|uniref:uncharacterized protein n=1 Tax=Antedon mediterranea TaxID=105859 RepID=UPI003AF55564
MFKISQARRETYVDMIKCAFKHFPRLTMTTREINEYLAKTYDCFRLGEHKGWKTSVRYALNNCTCFFKPDEKLSSWAMNHDCKHCHEQEMKPMDLTTTSSKHVTAVVNNNLKLVGKKQRLEKSTHTSNKSSHSHPVPIRYENTLIYTSNTRHHIRRADGTFPAVTLTSSRSPAYRLSHPGSCVGANFTRQRALRRRLGGLSYDLQFINDLFVPELDIDQSKYFNVFDGDLTASVSCQNPQTSRKQTSAPSTVTDSTSQDTSLNLIRPL